MNFIRYYKLPIAIIIVLTIVCVILSISLAGRANKTNTIEDETTTSDTTPETSPIYLEATADGGEDYIKRIIFLSI